MSSPCGSPSFLLTAVEHSTCEFFPILLSMDVQVLSNSFFPSLYSPIQSRLSQSDRKSKDTFFLHLWWKP